MAIKQRLLRAEKRLPRPPAVLQLPGVDVLVAESKRLKVWLEELGLTAAEAHKRGLKVPGNTFVTLKLRAEMDRRAEDEAMNPSPRKEKQHVRRNATAQRTEALRQQPSA